ncbi:MAG: hypothetical protein ACRDP6_19395 [Actinoallomurus sp.]
MRWTDAPRLVDAYWPRDGAANRQVIAWLTGGPAAAAVEAAFRPETREDVLGLLADLEPLLRPV